MDGFTLHASVSGTQATITVAGDLDASTAPRLRDRLRAEIEGGATSLVLDMGQVTFIESVGLGVIIAARRQLAGDDKRLCVVLDPGQTSIRKVFRVTGIDEVVPIYPTAEAAAEDCAEDPSAA